jgi:hypothetical protein
VYVAISPLQGPKRPAPFRGEFVSVERPPDAGNPRESVEAARMPDEMYLALRDRLDDLIRKSGAPGPDRAAHVAAEYAAFAADNDVDRMLALGLPVGATPNAEAVARFRVQLEAFPARGQPSGWKTFNDLQVLRWGFAISRIARWSSVALDTISVEYFPAGDVHDELAAFWRMNAPAGYKVSGKAQALFEIPGLNTRAHNGEVASLLVRYAVVTERGDEWLLTSLLAEHKPGEWYPISMRKDVLTTNRPLQADRAPRPR